MGEKKVKLLTFVDEMILYTENSKNSSKKKNLLEIVNILSTVAGDKSICKNLLCFYTIKIFKNQKKLRQQFHLQLLQKNKISRNKCHTEEKDMYTKTITHC